MLIVTVVGSEGILSRTATDRARCSRETRKRVEKVWLKLLLYLPSPQVANEVVGKVDGIPHSFLLDMGSAVTFINKDIWRKAEGAGRSDVQMQ